MDSENNLRKLAIYYAWPSCVRGLSEDKTSIDLAVQRFSPFDIIILGEGLESPKHGDHNNTKYIVERLPRKEVQGYIHLSPYEQYHPFSDEELEEKLERWKSMGMKGVLFDLINPRYNTTVERIAKIAKAAHDIKLHVTYNSEFDAVGEGWLKERITPVARAGDLILLEKFGTSWEEESYVLPETLPQPMLDLKSIGVAIVGVSTYDAEQVSVMNEQGRKILMERFLKYRAEAKRLGLDGYQFTNGLYSASGLEANILVDFDALAMR